MSLLKVMKVQTRRPDWLNSLLSGKFFVSCGDHLNLRKNEKNMFCVDCGIAFCKHCVSSSSPPCLHHQCFQICKYVYHDVVRLQDIQKHLDCSRIQTYKINGEKAIHLHPRPPSKDTKIAKLKGGTTCEACGKHIQDLPNTFCSIACKMSMIQEMTEERRQKIPKCDKLGLKYNSNEEDESMISLSESSEVIQAWRSSKLKSNTKLRRRKVTVPQRAPLL